MSIPPEEPPLSPIARIAARARLRFAKNKAEEAFQKFQQDEGPQAEYQTRAIYGQSELISVENIADDPRFQNFRTSIDLAKLSDLQTSIDLEGLRSPIVVIESGNFGHYYIRAGFRRLQAVRNLGWLEIPAIILPADTPESEEYWANILENSAREKLSTYEIACAAKLMRDKFEVSGATFAKKSGHSPSFIAELLMCADKLPPEVLHSWKRGDRVPFSIYFKLACMNPLEAIKNLRLWMGQHRIDTETTRAEEALRRLQTKRKPPDKLLTVRGIERTQRLLMAIKLSKLSADTKQLCTEVVEYCQGGRKRVNGIVDDHKHVPVQYFAPTENDDLDPDLPLPPVNELDEQRRIAERKFRQDEETFEGSTTHGSDQNDKKPHLR
jgi:ParB/RepB/Spo0J family partition protein